MFIFYTTPFFRAKNYTLLEPQGLLLFLVRETLILIIAHDFQFYSQKKQTKKPADCITRLPIIFYILRQKELPTLKQLSVYSKYKKWVPSYVADVGC